MIAINEFIAAIESSTTAEQLVHFESIVKVWATAEFDRISSMRFLVDEDAYEQIVETYVDSVRRAWSAYYLAMGGFIEDEPEEDDGVNRYYHAGLGTVVEECTWADEEGSVEAQPYPSMVSSEAAVLLEEFQRDRQALENWSIELANICRERF